MYLLRNIDIKIYYTEAKRQLQKEDAVNQVFSIICTFPDIIDKKHHYKRKL